MKKIFDLQLFAEETSTGAETASAAADQESGAAKEETKPATAAEPEKKYSDADLDRIIKGKKAEWQKQKDKEITEAQKLAEMNAEEKANYERDKAFEERDAAIKERDELKQAAALAEMSKTARKMLADEGISVSDELLSMLVTMDAEKTKAAVDGFTKLFKETVENAVKDRLRGETPKAGTGAAAPLTEIERRIKKYQ